MKKSTVFEIGLSTPIDNMIDNSRLYRCDGPSATNDFATGAVSAPTPNRTLDLDNHPSNSTSDQVASILTCIISQII
ncbi:hypothetical protein MXD63_01620 [Frankia sp. Cpl3]|nr:hypothetical protein [Frankia sp. Cpl3]